MLKVKYYYFTSLFSLLKLNSFFMKRKAKTITAKSSITIKPVSQFEIIKH